MAMLDFELFDQHHDSCASIRTVIDLAFLKYNLCTITMILFIRLLLVQLVLVIATSTTHAQSDSPGPSKETTPIIKEKVKARHSFKLSLIPGAGQISNKQYWKLPIVYGALGLGATLIFKERSSRKKLTESLQIYCAEIANTNRCQDNSGLASNDPFIKSIAGKRQSSIRTRNLLYIGTGLVYVAQTLDGYLNSRRSNPQGGLSAVVRTADGLGFGIAYQF